MLLGTNSLPVTKIDLLGDQWQSRLRQNLRVRNRFRRYSYEHLHRSRPPGLQHQSSWYDVRFHKQTWSIYRHAGGLASPRSRLAPASWATVRLAPFRLTSLKSVCRPPRPLEGLYPPPMHLSHWDPLPFTGLLNELWDTVNNIESIRLNRKPLITPQPFPGHA